MKHNIEFLVLPKLRYQQFSAGENAKENIKTLLLKAVNQYKERPWITDN